nr:centromere-associated protein E isoform X5 [Misgurnus anguillicaudatus]
MGSQGPGRKRTPSKNGMTGEEDALNLIAREAEARLAAKRAARAEAREIRMKELERQQKEIYQVQKKYYGLDNLDNKFGDIEQWMEDSERYTRLSRRHASVSDDEERMSVGSRSSMRLDLDAPGAYGGLSQATSSSHSQKKSKKKKKHSSKTSNGYDDDLSPLSSRNSRLSDESKRSRSSRLDLQSSLYNSEPYSSSNYSSKHQGLSYNGYQGSVYEDSLYSGSRRSVARTSSEYRGSSSRTSSRANSACGSPVEDCSSSVSSYIRSGSISGLSRDLDHVIIPDLPDVNGRLSMTDDRIERDYLEKGSSRASTISGATLTSLGGTSSRRGSGDTTITADTEASIREIKDSLLEVEDKYRKAMVSNAQLDNEKTNLIYEVDTLKDSLMELEEMLSETRRELEEKSKDLEREKHAHSILQFQFSELKETLKQSEELLTEIRQLRMKQDSFVREISDLQETIEWKNKKIGALERQKEFSDAIRNERDELRDEVVQLKDILKKHGIVLGPDLTTNGETGEELGQGDQNSQTSSAEIREGSSVLGTQQLKICKDQKDLDEEVQENHDSLISTKTSLETNDNGDLRDEVNQSVEQQSDNKQSEEPPSSVDNDEVTTTSPMVEIKAEQLVLEDSRDNTVESECEVHTDGPVEENQQETTICAKHSQKIEKETSVESVSGPVLDENQPSESVSKPVEKPAESSEKEKAPQTQGASASNKKRRKKKKGKQKQKQNDKQDSETKICDTSEKILNEDNPDQKLESDPEGSHEEQLGNDASTAVHTEVPADSHDDTRNIKTDRDEIISMDTVPADDARDQFRVITDVVDSGETSNPKTDFDCPESATVNSISNLTEVNNDQTKDSTNLAQEISSDKEALLSHELSDKSMDAVDRCVENLESSSISNNIEKSLLVDDKEGKSHVDSDGVEEKPRIQIIDPGETTFPGDHDESAPICHSSSSVIEKVENECEKLIQEQPTIPTDQELENNLQNTIEVEQKEIKTQTDQAELVEEALIMPSREVFSGDNNIDTAVTESQVPEKCEGEEERSLHDELPAEVQCTGENEADQESIELGDSHHESKLEKGEDENKTSCQGQVMLDTPPEDKDIMVGKGEEDGKKTSVQDEVMVKTQPTGKVEDIVLKKGDEDIKEKSVQDQVMVETQPPGENEDILVGKTEEDEKKESVQGQVMLDTQVSMEDKAILVEKVEEDEKERSVQNQVMLETQPTERDEEILLEKDKENEKEGSVQDQVMLETTGKDEDILLKKGEGAHEKEESVQGQIMLDKQPPGENKDILVEQGEQDEKEEPVQDQVMIDTQLSGEDEGILVESVTVSPEQKEEEEEDEGEAFDFDEMDLEASSEDPLKQCKNKPNEEVTLLKESMQEDQIKKDGEPLEPKNQMDDGQTIQNPQTTTEVEACLTEDSQVDQKDIEPNQQQHDKSESKECTFEEHKQGSEELRHNEGADLTSEIETKNVEQEKNSNIIQEDQEPNISREQEVEKPTAGNGKEDDRKESKKSAKKGKGKGKEDCKMS